jgi:hypothetical protein
MHSVTMFVRLVIHAAQTHCPLGLQYCSTITSQQYLLANAEAPDSADEQLPTDKLACRMGVALPRQPTVLLSCGSFNPPTIMHLRMFDLATAALAKVRAAQ